MHPFNCSMPARHASRGVVALVALIAAVAAVAIASAHARYDHSTPGQGQVVQTSPARVDIFTVQDMKKQTGAFSIMVQRSDATPGEQVDMADTTIDDNNHSQLFSVGLKPNLPAGRYVVSFNNVSDVDGEADHGQFAFYVGNGPTSAQKALDAKLAITSMSDTTSSSSHTGLIIGIVVAVVVVLVLAGGGFVFMRRRRAGGDDVGKANGKSHVANRSGALANRADR